MSNCHKSPIIPILSGYQEIWRSDSKTINPLSIPKNRHSEYYIAAGILDGTHSWQFRAFECFPMNLRKISYAGMILLRKCREGIVEFRRQ
jgi:hypothetical protein